MIIGFYVILLLAKDLPYIYKKKKKKKISYGNCIKVRIYVSLKKGISINFERFVRNIFRDMHFIIEN